MKEEIGKIKEEALKNNIPIIMDDTLETIKDILLENKPKRILEIGTGTGYSSICFYNILTVGAGHVSARVAYHTTATRHKN